MGNLNRSRNFISVFRTLPTSLLGLEALGEALRAHSPTQALLYRAEANSSYLFCDPVETLTIEDGLLIRKTKDSRDVISGKTPLLALQNHFGRIRHHRPQGFPQFGAGLFGYLGYDCVKYLEAVPLPKKKSVEPEACFILYQSAYILDHSKESLTVIQSAFQNQNRAAALRDLKEALEARIASLNTLPSPKANPPKRALRLSAIPLPKSTPARFEKGVEKIKGHIREGDIFQCVISERYQLPRATPSRVYQALLTLNPSPYHYCFQFEKLAIVGASPEPLVKISDQTVSVHPIAGTRPRGADTKEDKRMERQLKASVKEKAEHIMLVDLARNDLGRVSLPGSVKVDSLMKIARFSHVMHLVSVVSGLLKPNQTVLDALFACFPAGTLTGAPKIRAMEIISQVETKRRGAYGGAMVLADFNGNLDSCITIRSAVIDETSAYIQAGAGVVSDSKTNNEFQETYRKSLAIRHALGEAGRSKEAL